MALKCNRGQHQPVISKPVAVHAIRLLLFCLMRDRNLISGRGTAKIFPPLLCKSIMHFQQIKKSYIQTRRQPDEGCASVIFGSLVFQLSAATCFERFRGGAQRGNSLPLGAGVNLKMAWEVQRIISGFLTISTACLTLSNANGDNILHDTKQGRFQQSPTLNFTKIVVQTDQI